MKMMMAFVLDPRNTPGEMLQFKRALWRQTTTIKGSRSYEFTYEYYCTAPEVHQVP